MSLAGHLSRKPKIIFFTDFDGTITTTDSNDFLVANLGYGVDLLNASNLNVLQGKVPLSRAFTQQMHSIHKPLQECINFQCKYTDLDPGFKNFYRWAKASNVPMIVLSGGVETMIRALLSNLLGPTEAAEIEIISNEVTVLSGDDMVGSRDWKVKLHDDSPFGMDKSVYIQRYAEKLLEIPEFERPALLFAGDGVSDICAAGTTDLLFAKSGKDLMMYCERENIPFTTFDNWDTILRITKQIHQGNTVESARVYSSTPGFHKC